MSQTSREIVTRTLKFESPERLPRDIWRLPWAMKNLAETMAEIDRRWPGDMSGPRGVYRKSDRTTGNPHAIGEYTDPWGSVFQNIQEGAIGEVKNPVLSDLRDWKRIVKPPYETLPANLDAARDSVNRDCAGSTKFMRGGLNPRPWEQYQFLRGTENAMLDVMDPDSEIQDVLKVMHDFYLRECEFWCSTDIDAIGFMDDWGSQRQLLIPPSIWRALFKPLYKDYCNIAHAAGKFVFMHSDGYISEIYDDLIEIGVDALNSQLFCMDMADLARRAKGRITFWGEIDRQHVLPSKDPEEGRKAVREVASHFFDPRGGCIVQFEAGLGANPKTVVAVMEEWDAVQERGSSAK